MRGPKQDHWRLIVWNCGTRMGYAKLDAAGELAFTQDWRAATTLSTKNAWNAVRSRVHALGDGWSSTALNAPRVKRAEVSA